MCLILEVWRQVYHWHGILIYKWKSLHLKLAVECVRVVILPLLKCTQDIRLKHILALISLVFTYIHWWNLFCHSFTCHAKKCLCHCTNRMLNRNRSQYIYAILWWQRAIISLFVLFRRVKKKLGQYEIYTSFGMKLTWPRAQYSLRRLIWTETGQNAGLHSGPGKSPGLENTPVYFLFTSCAIYQHPWIWMSYVLCGLFSDATNYENKKQSHSNSSLVQPCSHGDLAYIMVFFITPILALTAFSLAKRRHRISE